MTTSLIMTEEFLTTTNDRSNPNRKPNTGMIRILLDEYQEDNGLPTISKLETLLGDYMLEYNRTGGIGDY